MGKRASSARRHPNDLGSVETLPSGRFRAYYRHDGRKFTAPHTFETKTAARSWLATERADRARGVWQDPNTSKVTVAEWADTWLASRTTLADSTRTHYKRGLAKFIVPMLGHVFLSDMTPPMVRRWFAEVSDLAAKTARDHITHGRTTHGHPARAWARANGHTVAATGRISPEVLTAWQTAQNATEAGSEGTGVRPGATAACHAYRTLRACLNAAKRDGLIASNPCTVEGAGEVRYAERVPASPEQVQRIADLMPPELRAAVLVAAWGALRFGELFALARRHVDVERGSVRVQRALTKTRGFGLPKTASSVRTVFLPRPVADALIAHMATFTADGPDALIFTSANGLPVRQGHVHKHFARARREVGREDLRWHDLRHTGATLAYTAGGNIRDVQRRLGHSTVRAAMIYAHAADEGDRYLAERMTAFFASPPSQPEPPRPTLTIVAEPTHHTEGTAA